MSAPAGAPAWDPADPAASREAYARWVLETARLTYLQDGTHLELFFLFTDQGLAGLQPAPVGLPRPAITAAVRAAVRDHRLTGVIHVAEARAILPTSPDDTAWFRHMDTTGPAQPEDTRPRVDTLLVRLEAADGASLLWLSPVVQTSEGRALADAIEVRQAPTARLGSYFRDPEIPG